MLFYIHGSSFQIVLKEEEHWAIEKIWSKDCLTLSIRQNLWNEEYDKRILEAYR